jgi:phospholipid/cholesterol/gamma-HCH transport system substrate-binding protein
VPEFGQLVRDLREATETLNDMTERLNREGAGSLLGARQLPEYEPQ